MVGLVNLFEWLRLSVLIHPEPSWIIQISRVPWWWWWWSISGYDPPGRRNARGRPASKKSEKVRFCWNELVGWLSARNPTILIGPIPIMAAGLLACTCCNLSSAQDFSPTSERLPLHSRTNPCTFCGYLTSWSSLPYPGFRSRSQNRNHSSTGRCCILSKHADGRDDDLSPFVLG